MFIFCATMFGCSMVKVKETEKAACHLSMSDEEIIEAVNKYALKKWGGGFNKFDKKDGRVVIRRERCGYLFYFRSDPPSPGAHWTYEIDEHGVIISERLGS